jgi:hypothetical protein
MVFISDVPIYSSDLTLISYYLKASISNSNNLDPKLFEFEIEDNNFINGEPTKTKKKKSRNIVIKDNVHYE